MNPWRRIERGCLQSLPGLLVDADECYFAREYLSHQDHSASPANSLIKNFKIKPTVQNYVKRKFYKEKSARQFSAELSVLLPAGVSVSHVPTSKLPGHPEYDPRFDMLFSALRLLRPDLRLERALTIADSHEAAHEGGPRGINHFYDMLEWNGLQHVTDEIVVVDDVITSGAHFKACQAVLAENGVEKAVGVFWGVAVAPPAADIDISELLKGL